jgi:hypothetical protein
VKNHTATHRLWSNLFPRKESPKNFQDGTIEFTLLPAAVEVFRGE